MRLPSSASMFVSCTLVFCSQTHLGVGVTQTVAVIKIEAGQQAHVDRVRALAAEADSGTPGNACARMSQWFHDAGVELPADAMVSFLEGARDSIAKAKEIGPEFIAQARDDVMTELVDAGAFEPWLGMQMDGINVEFVQRCMAALQSERV
eukprot:m.82448 g.82448  ORF g.82448 m.82448 type:complete len:150 (+) comp9467_c0_seq3:30-479(+)